MEIYVDAAGFGHHGITLYVDGARATFPTHCPEWMTDPDIYDLEMRAFLFGLRIAAELKPRRADLV